MLSPAKMKQLGFEYHCFGRPDLSSSPAGLIRPRRYFARFSRNSRIPTLTASIRSLRFIDISPLEAIAQPP
jgi:hypothetical protein